MTKRIVPGFDRFGGGCTAWFDLTFHVVHRESVVFVVIVRIPRVRGVIKRSTGLLSLFPLLVSHVECRRASANHSQSRSTPRPLPTSRRVYKLLILP